MTRKKSASESLINFPLDANLDINIDKKNIEIKKSLEFNPSKLQPDEAMVVQVKKWAGLSNQTFAILNLGGKELVVKQIKEEKRRAR